MCGCNVSLDRSKEAACLSLPLLAACPTTSAEGSGGGTCQPSPEAVARALPPAKPAANTAHTPALGCRAAKSCSASGVRPWEKRTKLQVVGRVTERVGEQREKAEQESSWMPFYFTFSNGGHLFCAPSCNIRGAAEVLKGKREA